MGEIPEDLRTIYYDTIHYLNDHQGSAPYSNGKLKQLIERIAALTAELAQVKAENALWRSEHDPCPFALELEQVKAENALWRSEHNPCPFALELEQVKLERDRLKAEVTVRELEAVGVQGLAAVTYVRNINALIAARAGV
jgi:hypothetical protein